MSWRYFATRMNGDGTETQIANDIPITGVSSEEALSGPGGINGTITPEIAQLKDEEGNPIFVPWSTALYIEEDGIIRGGAIFIDTVEEGPDLQLETMGHSGYAHGPYLGEFKGIEVDPLDMARHIWDHLQSQPDGNIGMQLSDIKSPVRIGEPEREVNFQTGSGENVSFMAGPYKLAFYQTDDLGKEFDDLAKDTPFDYRVTHKWVGNQIEHFMHIGYPTIGRRLHNLRFKVGENVFVVPQIDRLGDDYASEVHILGAGEGRDMVRGIAHRRSGRLRRAVVVSDKSITSAKKALQAAEQEVKFRLGEEDVSSILVLNHPHAPIGSYSVGDEILFRTSEGWSKELALWVRILSITIDPESDTAQLSVIRVDKVE